MPLSRIPVQALRALVLLAAIAAIGYVAVSGGSGPDDAGDLWPVGLATGALCLATRRARPVVLVAIVGVGVATMWWGGRALDVACGLAAGGAAGSWVVWRLTCGANGERRRLVTDRDFLRFLLAVLVAALVAGLVAAATSAVTGWNSPVLVGLATGTAHLASQLVVVPFFLRGQERPSLAGPAETAALWATTIVVTPLLFASSQVPALVFLVIPTLIWGAMRVAPRQALWQLALVSTTAIAMTMYGWGPFAYTEGGHLGLGIYGPNLFVELFVIASVLAVVPLLLNVGQKVGSARDASATEDDLHKIMESALTVAIIGTDPDGRVTFFSPGAQRMLGYELPEVLGQSVERFYDPAEITAQAVELGVQDVFADVVVAFVNAPQFGPVRDLSYVRKDGQRRTHATSVVRRVDGRGSTIGFVITAEDVTDRVQAQASLVQALEVERRAVDRLRQIDQIKDDLISTVSHELRTPITSIVGYVELFEDGVYGEVNDQQLGALGRVGSNSSRLLTLVDKLLTLSRIQDDGHEVVDETMDLCDVLRAGFEIVATESRTRGLDVRLELPSAPVPFLGDQEMLERVVVNLVDNAIKFTPAGGRVGVHLTATSDAAVIRVTDTGIGIPEDEQELLSTRFFRSSLTKKQEIPGTGLGLSITRAVVEMHDGTLRVESSPGMGTTFEVRLPRHGHARPTAHQVPASDAVMGHPSRGGGSHQRRPGAPSLRPTTDRRELTFGKDHLAAITYEQLFPTPRPRPRQR